MKFWQAIIVTICLFAMILLVIYGFTWAFYNISPEGTVVAGAIAFVLVVSWGLWAQTQ